MMGNEIEALTQWSFDVRAPGSGLTMGVAPLARLVWADGWLYSMHDGVFRIVLGSGLV
jgi:hypothetical protein